MYDEFSPMASDSLKPQVTLFKVLGSTQRERERQNDSGENCDMSCRAAARRYSKVGDKGNATRFYNLPEGIQDNLCCYNNARSIKF